jgi:pimeloyl-ACP methyl ester carboxylesterase
MQMSYIKRVCLIGLLSSYVLVCAAQERVMGTPPAQVAARPAGPGSLSRSVPLGDGRHLSISCLGTGSPTVILEAGLDWGGSRSWMTLLPEVARFTRVCAYDRAGSGFSDPGPLPRDGKHIVSDLHALLGAAGERPPYVLVGQSLGGALVRLYRLRHPNDVGAMVLVDPSQPGPNEWRKPWVPKFRKCLELAKLGAITTATTDCMPPGGVANRPAVVVQATVQIAKRPGTWRDPLSEIEHFDSYFEQLETGEHPPVATPTIVLTASEQGGLDQKARADWIAGHAHIAAQFMPGEQRLIVKSSHGIQLDRPEVIVQAVRDVIREATSHL